MAAATGLIDAAEATHNPSALFYALFAYGFAFGDADRTGALEAARRGLVIAQDSGNRETESELAGALSRLEAEYGDPLAAFDYFTLAIGNYPDAGNVTLFRGALATPLIAATNPEISTAVAHLRDVLGDQTCESLARRGESMSPAAMATYAYGQIDQARAELNVVSQ
jgi:hypothetical protein